MEDEIKLADAKKVYSTLCEAIERRGWHFEKNDEKLYVYFHVNGDDIPMSFIMTVDVQRQLVRLTSPIGFNMSEDKRIEGAIATCAATFGLADGSFDYNFADGAISFRMTASFRGCTIGEGLLQYMISYSCAAVDKFNDKFLAIDKGFLSINDFIASNG